MLEIRRLVVDGHNYEEIQEALGIPKRTFYRYLKKVFEDDKRALEKQNVDEMMREVAILLERYNTIYRELQGIATDPKVRASDRMYALAAMSENAKGRVNFFRDAPALSIVQKRKLLAIKEGVVVTGEGGGKLRLPPVFDSLPDRYHDYNSADMNTEKVNDEDNNVDTFNGDRRDTECE